MIEGCELPGLKAIQNTSITLTFLVDKPRHVPNMPNSDDNDTVNVCPEHGHF